MLDHLSLQCSPPNMRRYSHGVHNNVHDSTALVACNAENLPLERLANLPREDGVEFFIKDGGVEKQGKDGTPRNHLGCSCSQDASHHQNFV